MHHVPVTPDVMLSGEIEFTYDRAVHLCVVAHDDAGFIRQIFCTFNFCFRIKQMNKPSDYSVYYGCLFVVQSSHLPLRTIIVRQRKVFNILNTQVLLKILNFFLKFHGALENVVRV